MEQSKETPAKKELLPLILDSKDQQEADAAKLKAAEPEKVPEPPEAKTEGDSSKELDPADVKRYLTELQGWREGQKRNLDLAKGVKETARAEEEKLKDQLALVEKEKAEAQKLLGEARKAIEQAGNAGDSAAAKRIIKMIVEDGIIDKAQADSWLQEKGLVKQIDPSEFPNLVRQIAEEEMAKVRKTSEEQTAMAELQTAIQLVTTSTSLKATRVAPMLISTLTAGEASTPTEAAKLLIKEFGKGEPEEKDKSKGKNDLPELIF